MAEAVTVALLYTTLIFYFTVQVQLHVRHPRWSIHSRAARRATSPSINLDKSLKNVQLPSDDRSKVLLVHQGAGITKRKGKGKALSRQKRIRREKGSQRAEAVMDQMEKKVERVIVKGRTVKERGVCLEAGGPSAHD